MTVRDRALHVAAILALAGPTALAFASGGYFDEARLVALVGAWALVLVAIALGAPVPQRRAAWVALGALAAFTAWVAIAGGWAQLAATARADLERDVLYLGALTAAVLLLGGVRWLVEPVLAAGTVVVVGYALAGRLVPGIVELSATASAGGRLDQPLTYWNAMGALSALGVVLTVRLAGEPLRPRALRVAAAAGAVPLTVGLLLTFSRGALIAAAVGVVLVVLLAPTAAQLRAAACALVPGAVAAFVANRRTRCASSREPSRRASTRGSSSSWCSSCSWSLAGVLQWLAIGRPQRTWPVVPARRLAGLAVVAALVLVPVVTALAGSGGGDEAGFGATTARLGSASSNRADYWRVAWEAAGDQPLQGLGPGGFGPVWLQERPYPEAVKDAHSLPLETLTELGLVGLALLLTLVGAVAVGARDALRADAALAAGPTAVAATWFVHAAIDWDWEMPALTLIAVACAGLLLSDAATRQRAG